MAATLTLLGASACRKQETAADQHHGERVGHAATVRCLRGERALTDGDELRCEDWDYVSSNYGATSNTAR